MGDYTFGDNLEEQLSVPDPFGLETTFDTNSVIRPHDSTRGFGEPVPDLYRTQIDLLKTTQEQQHKNAIEDLHKALQAQDTISPTQGLAAALLAAIPTFGGYLMGKSVGSPTIPKGVYGVNLANHPTGGSAGLEMGAQVGGKVSQGYLKSLDDTPEEKAILLKEAEWNERQSNSQQSEINQLTNAGLRSQEARANALDPALQDAKVNVASRIAEVQQNAKSKASLAGQNDPDYISYQQKLMTPPEQGGGLEHLTSGERASALKYEGSDAVKTAATIENANSRRQTSNRLEYGDSKWAQLLGVNRPDGPFKVKDPNQGAFVQPKEAETLLQQASTATNAIRAMKDAQTAFNTLGVAVDTIGQDPQASAKIGAALHQIQFARKTIMDAYLSGSVLAKGAVTDKKMEEIEELLVPPPLTEGNASRANIRAFITQNAPMREAKFEEISNNILNTLQANSENRGLTPNYEVLLKNSKFNASSLNSNTSQRPSRTNYQDDDSYKAALRAYIAE